MPEITPAVLADLKAKATAALPPPGDKSEDYKTWNDRRHAFDQVASPAVVLALLAEVERLNRRYGSVEAERQTQDARWGGPEHDRRHSPDDWLRFIDKHFSEAWAAFEQGANATGRYQIVRVAALCVAALELCDAMLYVTTDEGRAAEAVYTEAAMHELSPRQQAQQRIAELEDEVERSQAAVDRARAGWNAYQTASYDCALVEEALEAYEPDDDPDDSIIDSLNEQHGAAMDRREAGRAAVLAALEPQQEAPHADQH